MTHQDTGFSFTPTSTAYEKGKFGRLFPWLPPCIQDSDPLSELYAIAELMKEDATGSMPAGYTYLGQFLAHDLSFDPTSLKERQIDMEFLYNFRTPALDLDCLYGGGPSVMPYLYKKVPRVNAGNDPAKPLYGMFDIEPGKAVVNRVGGIDGQAVIADPRNDENAIITQLHAALMLLHNKFLEEQNSNDPFLNFFLARQQTTWHYQYVVLRDYLPRIVGKKLVRKILKKRKYYDWRNEPFIPLEFSAAAFRYGHSQIKDNYRFNEDIRGPIFIEKPSKIPNINWSLFFFDQSSTMTNENLKIGPHVADAVRIMNDADAVLDQVIQKIEAGNDVAVKREMLINFVLDVGWKINEKNLAFRNLLRGKLLRLPSGQSVAKAMKKTPLSIKTANFPERFRENTPLWYYILYEAKVLEEGRKLGPVGARIVAEVIIGVLQGDKTSFLNHNPKWIPKIKNDIGEIVAKPDFDMMDLLKKANIYYGL